MIKCIIFDYNGVFNNTHNKPFAETLHKKYGVSKKRIKYILNIKGDEHDLGIINSEKYWSFFRDKIGIKDNIDYELLFYKSTTTYMKMFNIAQHLRKKYKIVLLTNLSQNTYNFENKRFKLDKRFDKIFSSFKIKMRKPHLTTYKHVLFTLKAKPCECIFVDDSMRNIKSAKKLGLNTIHFKNINQFKKELKKFKL